MFNQKRNLPIVNILSIRNYNYWLTVPTRIRTDFWTFRLQMKIFDPSFTLF